MSSGSGSSADGAGTPALALFIVPRTVSLARSAVRILVQATPENVDVSAVERTLREIDGVRAGARPAR
ncbi:hypothetical protein [Actinoplanes sp. ATCC 53533]|uniref:hypothetical protein n=1 Tax=Actinoplanes sp. ATCC 53533 TaxID=1288362 RepID=UPI000F79BD63|nr:hypothetical protein [Actinoplanes sp. ATCC 53533]